MYSLYRWPTFVFWHHLWRLTDIRLSNKITKESGGCIEDGQEDSSSNRINNCVVNLHCVFITLVLHFEWIN
jgi:hypothetical protein